MKEALASLAILALTACSNGQGVSDAVPVRVQAARVATFSPTFELAGSVEAARSVTLGSVVTGRVAAMNVRVGDRVRAGDVVAQIDPSQYAGEYAQQQGAASAASAQLEAAQARLQLASVTASRMRGLYAQGGISAQENDQAQSDLAAARAAANQARGSVAAAGAGTQVAAVALNETTIRAPFDGVITSRGVEPGAVVGPGATIATLQNEGDLELDVTLPNASAKSLRTGMPVDVRVDELGDATIRARVRALAPQANPELRSMIVKIALPSRPGLVAGMYARVTVNGAAATQIAIPTSALVTRAGQTGAFVARDGRAEFAPLQVGAISGAMLAVRGTLHAGDLVIATNVERVTEGTAITVESK